jgi:hypothetical protein
MKIFRNIILFLGFILVFHQLKGEEKNQIVVEVKLKDEKDKIEHLIKTVENLSNAQFYRNGTYYDAKTAADHLRMKLKNAPVPTTYITAEQFIKYVASSSYMSGKEYHIKFEDGKIISSKEFLTKELHKLEQSSQNQK